MILNAFPAGGNDGLAVFSYTGLIKKLTVGAYEYLYLLTSGTLKLKRNVKMDLFMIGGGGAGGGSHSTSTFVYSGGGGAGGAVFDGNVTLESGTYDIVIGTGGANNTDAGDTTVKVTGESEYLYSAAGGNNAAQNVGGDGSSSSGSGGNGGKWESGTAVTSPTNGETGVYPFGDTGLDVYGGGGNGGAYSNTAGANGGDNTGKGGGGHGAVYSGTVSHGGSGIVIIRVGG